jgi:hypothetical protein
MLSDYRIGALDETENTGVKTHLSTCPGCLDVFKDLNLIIEAATILRTAEDIPPGISFPDENAMWQRMGLDTKTIH